MVPGLTEFLEGVENFQKILVPSASVGEVVAIDVSYSIGELTSSIAKLVDIIAQIFIKWGADGAKAALNIQIEALLSGMARLEGKEDAEAIAIGRLITESTQHGEKLDRLEVN